MSNIGFVEHAPAPSKPLTPTLRLLWEVALSASYVTFAAPFAYLVFIGGGLSHEQFEGMVWTDACAAFAIAWSVRVSAKAGVATAVQQAIAWPIGVAIGAAVAWLVYFTHYDYVGFIAYVGVMLLVFRTPGFMSPFWTKGPADG